MKDIWKPILSGKYEVSNLGKIRNASTGRELKPFTDKLQTYDRVELYEGGISRKFMVHILVAEAFLGPKPKGMEIDHLNTNLHDNRLCNLAYVSQDENRDNPITKFNYEVSRIRRAIRSGKKSQQDILRLVEAMRATI